jgi:outer membrane translocation and assembly module TamA
MRWRLRGRLVIPSVISLLASPVGILAQCPRRGYIHFLFKPDHPARHAAVDDVTIGGAPDLEGLIRTKVDTWLERNPSEESGETDVTIQVEPERLAAERTEMEEELRRDAAESDSRWVEALGESVKEVLQDNGFFRAQVTVEKIVLSSDANQDHVSLAIHISEGKQYRLGDIQFNGAHVFPPWQLRNQIPLGDGAVFDLSKLRKGVENLDKTYSPLGYINFTASPNVEIDDAHQRISVTFDLDEDRKFTVGRVQVLGLATDAPEKELKIRLKTGDPFNPELVDEFYSDNKSILPPNASKENTQISQNLLYNIVDVVFDFRPCP